MKTHEKIERKGWKITYGMTGWIIAEKNGIKIKSLSITEIYNAIKYKRV